MAYILLSCRLLVDDYLLGAGPRQPLVKDEPNATDDNSTVSVVSMWAVIPGVLEKKYGVADY